ncbi:2,5-dichloro-2,5-cyclohexadiene-1,4-diol dehydrogenase [Lasiodiplodia theobromae]|uniref:2,5-dichloro-2,5-cyclohexadiene-1,4-diol dehydrogenase n=1 Tax=Lasiodiplodia theobromae TaxID=45133 RepID=A0A5N5D2K1_9PEZI|nr:2,5-dichloro-2,5-cyclohexadiene-1,4-diol dehydrogenase [Lasiodiplodia theobromae]
MDIDGFALIIGAGSGIGKACALAYAAEGAAGAVMADIHLAATEATAAESLLRAAHSSFRAVPVQVNVTDQKSVEALVRRTIDEFGRIDYALNCAGIGVEAEAEVSEVNVDEFDRFHQVNVRGMLLVTRQITAAMKLQEPRAICSSGGGQRGASRGVIINVGSASSYVATPRLVQYTTSKYAVLGLTRNAALDNAQHGIRVNCLCPSWVDTPMIQRAIQGAPQLQQFIEAAVPMGRIAQPEEISDAVIFLSSPRSSYITGTGFIIDGGTTLTAKI